MFLRLFLTVEECFDEVCLLGHQRLRPRGHRPNVSLERFGFLESVLHGVIENRLGRGSPVMVVFEEAARLFLSFACFGTGLHGSVALFVSDVDCSGSVFCERLWDMTVATVVCCKGSCIVCKSLGARRMTVPNWVML